MPSRPRRALISNGDAAEVGSIDVRNSVVLGQSLVHERVVGVQNVENIAVFANDAVEQQLGFALECLSQVVIEVRINQQVGFPVPQFAQRTAIGRRSS